MLSLRRTKAQGTLEYVIILSALVAACIVGTQAVRRALIGDNPQEATSREGLIGQAAGTITDFTAKLPGAQTKDASVTRVDDGLGRNQRTSETVVEKCVQ